jgi:hypothetical protein
MDIYQILSDGERYAEDRDHGYEVVSAASIGVTYRIYQDAGGSYFVGYLPDGPASLRHVIAAEHLTWAGAMDLVRDRVAADLANEFGESKGSR